MVPVILNEVAGYYNDLTEKVTKDDPDILVPKYYVDTGEKVYFSIGIFQYGLAAYDLYLKTSEAAYEKKFIACAEWALDNQQKNGSWLAFPFENTEHPYSSMTQGEGISLLIRAHITTGKKIISMLPKERRSLCCFRLKKVELQNTLVKIYFFMSIRISL